MTVMVRCPHDECHNLMKQGKRDCGGHGIPRKCSNHTKGCTGHIKGKAPNALFCEYCIKENAKTAQRALRKQMKEDLGIPTLPGHRKPKPKPPLSEKERDMLDIAKRKSDISLANSLNSRFISMPVHMQEAIRARQMIGAAL